MKFETFSPKQLAVLSWWHPDSPHHSRDAVICDGAVRSGKSLCLSISFVLWSMAVHPGKSFALCGKTIVSLRRNVILPLMDALGGMGFGCKLLSAENRMDVSRGGRCCRYYLFGGRDEGSAALIQGITLAGVLLDEVALMPRSFVEQALARCSVEGSRFWFNCNPEHPGHWFYREWIQGAERKNACIFHFAMGDNPSLSPVIVERYQTLYTGVFHRRYVLGEWAAAHGAVYPMFSGEHVVDDLPQTMDRYAISCDYGTVNPASFGLWGRCGSTGVWYRVREYYHDSRRAGLQLTDVEYRVQLAALAGDLPVELVVVDPSAASFIQCLRRWGRFPVVPAQNGVIQGIRRVAAALAEGRIRIHRSCADCIREFGQYRWKLDTGEDLPVKEHDHAMDDVRYFVSTVLEEDGAGGFAALSVARE